MRSGKKFPLSLFVAGVPYVAMEAPPTPAFIDIKGLTGLFIKVAGVGLWVYMRRAGWALGLPAGG